MDSQLVYFDLETTGLDVRKCEIIQIAATTDAGQSCNFFIKPLNSIPSEVTKINGLAVVGGDLYKNGRAVESLQPKAAWQNFIKFLRSVHDNVTLMGHNAHRFDFPLLVRDMLKHGMLEELRSAVSTFVDSVKVFQAKLPSRPWYRFKLSDLANHYGVDTTAAHDALEDGRILSQLCHKIGVSSDDISNQKQSLDSYFTMFKP
ncbi:uncharacterized protein LOC113205662 [Frankliniella occidentalis]|uniref:Uncharacterized protein LOC113205662 n=1 Tax=Frankliniella occidentalis TaxID=133901 RepID=A0A6J1SEV5_FRAOC|nr:uncharacterized protein LOC113205662 [Frankliniella occidentalis]